MAHDNQMLGLAINNAAAILPAGYTINVVIARDSGDAVLYDEDGEECEFASNREHLAETINDAVAFAVEERRRLDAKTTNDDIQPDDAPATGVEITPEGDVRLWEWGASNEEASDD